MPNKSFETLPQNLKHLLMEIGEKSALLMLYLHSRETDWNVYQNLADSGCDVILINSNGHKLKIEVKARQRIQTKSLKGSQTVHFSLSENEYNSCQFLIAYWFEKNYYFIVPKEFLKQTKYKDGFVYKFIAGEKINGDLNQISEQFHDKWELIFGAGSIFE